MMGNLRRDAAPLTERTWKAIDEAVAQAARHVLAGRRVATFDGPRGWDHAATRLGTMKPCATREGKATVCVEEMALLAEVRAEFALSWTTLELFDRGAPALDTGPAENAAREVALAEEDRKSTRLNSSHGYISYAVFCLKKKKNISNIRDRP